MTPSAGFSGTFTHQVQAPPVVTGSTPPVSMPAPQQAWLPKIAVIGALGIAGGFLALRFSEKSMPDATAATVAPSQLAPRPASPAPSQGNAPTAATGTGEAPPSDPQAEEQHHAFVTITSVPAGANVMVDGKTYGETPADIEWWGELARPGREVTFTLQKAGFEKVTLVRSITGEKLSVEATLPRSNPSVRRRATDAARTPKAPVVVPDNFKDDPY
jgi:hypothetical protein